MECLDVEFVAESCLGLVADRAHLELPDLVGERLARDRHETLGFRHSARLCDRGVFVHEIEHLLPRPALGMNTCVNDEPNRSPELGVEAAKVLVGIRIDADFLTERLGIQAPTL